MKFLFVTYEALSADLAWQLKKEGHEVKFYCHDQPEKDVGDGFFEKVDQWEPLKDWADVIIMDDIGFGTKADQLRAEGKKVIGGSAYTDKLELDREFGQAELKASGVNVLPSWNFDDFDKAVALVKEKPDRYVIKPSGKAQSEKELLFVGQEEDGKDVLAVLEHYKANWSRKIKEFQIQKFAEGVEVAVGTFFNGKDFVYPINTNFEHKRLFPSEIGPSTGEMGTSVYYARTNPIFENTLLRTKERLAASGYVGYVDINCIANSKGIWPLEWTCFDDQTELLTREGWKRYTDIRQGDEALAIEPETRKLQWAPITGKIVKDFDGEMVRLGARDKSHSALDALVTPDHNLLIDHSGRALIVPAGKIPVHDTKIIRTGQFEGSALESVEIPAYVEQHALGRHHTMMEIVHPAVKMHSHVFLAFLGLYLAEGSTGGNDHTVTLSQSPTSNKRSEIEKILDQTNLKYTVQRTGAYQFNSTQLFKFLDALGLARADAYTKFIPTRYKDLAPDLLASLLKGYTLGDGNVHGRTGQFSWGTVSPKLADDLQEIITKMGGLANIGIRKSKGTKSIGGYVRRSDLFTLSLRKVKKDYTLDKRVISRQKYKGKVWDVEVAGLHTMLVRRNGKPYFSSNCRFGYPTISIQMEGITSEWGSFLADLAAGKDAQLKAKKGYQVGVVVCIPPWPFEDEKAFRKYSEGATILFRRQSRDGVHIGEVKQENGDWHIAGRSGYALIVTGSGATMSDAIRAAYTNVRNVMIPNMFFRNDIGQRWARDSDMLLSWGYL